MKLWVDDIREPPGEEWLWAKNYEEAVATLIYGNVHTLSLDHDLGEDKTGYDIVCLIERQIGKGGWWRPVPEILVHSANPVGRDNINRAIDSIQRLLDEKVDD